MSHRLADKVVIVTGASQGMGEATALRLAEEGARLVLSDMTPDVLATAGEVAKSHPSSAAVGVVTDVTKPQACRDLVAAALAHHGKLDSLIVVTAVLQKKGPLVDLDPDEWDRVMAVNAKGPFLLCQSAIPALTRPGGSIVLMGSFAGQVGLAEYSAYSASKGAIRALTHSLALELAPQGITVNAVAPAFVESALDLQHLQTMSAATGKSVEELRAARNAAIPLKRQATAREVANTIVFLASPEAAYVTGACLDVNGGVLLR